MAATYTVENILVKIGDVLIDGTSVGGTKDALVWAIESNDHIIDYIAQAPKRKFAVRRRAKNYTIKFNMLEATLENLKLALDLKSDISIGAVKSITGGGDLEATEHELIFYGEAPGGFQRKFTAAKAIFIDPGEIPFAPNDPTTIPCTLLILPDPGAEEGQEDWIIEDNLS